MDEFFRRYFPGDREPHLALHARLAEMVPAEGALLDLGCGDHRQLAGYRTQTRQVWGTDREIHPRLSDRSWFRPLRNRDRIPFGAESFDLVASTWVLEHVASPTVFLREVNRVLRPGGRFVALTCNGRHYVTWITRLMHALPHEITQATVELLYGRPRHDTYPTHFRLNTAEQLRRAGDAAGMRLTNIHRLANPDYFSFCTPLCHTAVVADWLLERLLPGTGRLYLIATWEKPGQSVPGQRQAA